MGRSRARQRNQGAAIDDNNEVEGSSKHGFYLAVAGIQATFEAHMVVGHYLKKLFAQFLSDLADIAHGIEDADACESLLGFTAVLVDNFKLFAYVASGDTFHRGEQWLDLYNGGQYLLNKLAYAWEEAFREGGPLNIDQEGSIVTMLTRFQHRLAVLPTPYQLNFDPPTMQAVHQSVAKLQPWREDAENAVDNWLAGIFWTSRDALEEAQRKITNWDAALARDGGEVGDKCKDILAGSDTLLGHTIVMSNLAFLLDFQSQATSPVKRRLHEQGQRYLDQLEFSWRRLCYECRTLLGEQEPKYFRLLQDFKDEVEGFSFRYAFHLKKVSAARTTPNVVLRSSEVPLQAHPDLQAAAADRAQERKQILLMRLRRALEHPDVQEFESVIAAVEIMLEQGLLCEDEIHELDIARLQLGRLRAEARERRDRFRRGRGRAALLAPAPRIPDEPEFFLAEPPPVVRQKKTSKAELQRARRKQAAAAKLEAKEAAERAALLRAYPKLADPPPSPSMSDVSTSADDGATPAVMDHEVPCRPRPRAPVNQRQQLQLKLGLQDFHRLFESSAFQQQSLGRDDNQEGEGREEVDEERMREIDPFQVRFTHNSISAWFRSGTQIDQAISDISSGNLSFSFPPLEVVWRGGALYSLSNRRLYLSRVLACLGALKTVPATVFPFECERVQCLKWDARLGRTASKWDRAFSTTNGGLSVLVRSRYAHIQTPSAARKMLRRSHSVRASRFSDRSARRRSASADS